MRSLDLLTSIWKEMLNMQISSTQVHKNRSALLFPPPLSSPASELLLLVPASFLVSSLPFIPHHPPPRPSPSFFLLLFPSHLFSFPFYIFLPPSGPVFLTEVWMDKQGIDPYHHWQWGATMDQRYFKKFQSPLQPWVPVHQVWGWKEGLSCVAMLWALDPPGQGSSLSSAYGWCDLGQVTPASLSSHAFICRKSTVTESTLQGC